MKSIKQAMYKLIVSMCIVLTFCSFLASTPVYASKVSNDFYYSGTTKGSYTVEAGLLEKIARAIPSIDTILDYLLGIFALGPRIVFVGWTALMERALTWILLSASGEGDKVKINEVSPSNVTETDEWVTLDAIFFNRVPLLDINFFRFEVDHEHDATGNEIADDGASPAVTPEQQKEDDEKTLIMILKNAIAGWYYTFRAISFMVMLVILVYIGVKLAINSATKEKALYKRVLVDWVIGMILVFSIHYIMLFIINFNEVLVETLSSFREGAQELEVYEYGLIDRAEKPVENDELEVNLYDEVRTRAYDAKLSVGTTGMIMYMVLVYYAWKYTFIYLKRYLTIAVLTMVAPLISATYAFNKVNSGKSVIFSRWFKEYLFTVLLQSVHALLYIIFLDTALRISLKSVASIILVFCLMNMMSKAEGLFRRIFGITGSLTDDIAAGGGLKDAINDMKGIATAMVGGKIAKSYIKTSAKVLTKPVRAVGEKTVGSAFSAHMVNKAKKLEKQRLEERDAFLASGGKESDFVFSKDAEEQKKNRERLKSIRNASLANAISNGNIDVASLRKAVDSLKKGQQILDDDGRQVGIVTDDYIKSEKAAVAELEAIRDGKVDGKDLGEWAKEYKKLTSKRALAGQYVGKKWKEIMDPAQYTKLAEVVRDKDGKLKDVKYKALEKTREDNDYESAIGKALYGGKVTDSISKRFTNHFKAKNLFNLNEESQQALKSQMELTKKGITGFLGTFSGLALLVAEPKLGSMFLYKGVENLGSISTAYGKRMRKAIKNTKNIKSLDAKSRYILTGFEGASQQTIANGAQSVAREQAMKLGESRSQRVKSTVKNVKTNHPKLAASLHIGGTIAAVTVGTKATLTAVKSIGAPATIGATVGAVSIYKMYERTGNVGSNLWMNFQNVARASRKANSKAFEKEMKENGMKIGFSEAFMNTMAYGYSNLEEQKVDEYVERHQDGIEEKAQTFGAIYTAYLAEQRERIDNLTDEELQLENSLEEPIEVVEVKKGGEKKQQLSAESEKALIDNAIIETAKKLGMMDLSEIEKSSAAIKDVAKQMSDDLKRRGIIKNTESVESLLDNIDKKVKDRAAVLSAEGTKPIEEKLTDEAIVEVMQKGDSSGKPITDPSKVDTSAVAEVYQRKFNSIAGVKPTAGSASVLAFMQQAKANETAGEDKGVSAADIEKITTIIEARKTSLADRAKKPLSKKSSKAMKEQLKKKMEVSLDTALMQNAEQLASETQATMVSPDGSSEETVMINNLNGILANESGGVGTMGDGSRIVASATDSAKKTDSVLKMLEIQTKMHKEKVALDSYVTKRGTTVKRREARYVQELRSENQASTVNVSQTRDGSRRVGGQSVSRRTAPTGKSVLGDKSIDDLLKTLKSNM